MAMLHNMITLRQLSLYWIQISILCLFSSILHAQQLDQSYQSWKTQQQAHDQRLKASSSTADYNLGKPSLQNTSATSKQSSSKNKRNRYWQWHSQKRIPSYFWNRFYHQKKRMGTWAFLNQKNCRGIPQRHDQSIAFWDWKRNNDANYLKEDIDFIRYI